jgi:hypothetical protein
MSRWLIGFPAHWDVMSPGFDKWRNLQELIALGVCADTATPFPLLSQRHLLES